MSTIGFFSVVQKPWDRRHGTLTVRARRREDLVALKRVTGFWMTSIDEDATADYRYRVRMQREDVSRAAAKLIELIEYDNFKAAAPADRHAVYLSAWNALGRLQPVGRPVRGRDLFTGLFDDSEPDRPKRARRRNRRPARGRRAGGP